MTPGQISKRMMAERIDWIQQMLAGIRALPLGDKAAFGADPRNVAAAESYLWRALEALFDLGRHVLAKAFGVGSGTHREVAAALREHGVLDASTADLLAQLAGYRNRIMQFCHAVTEQELYQICTGQLDDIVRVVAALKAWMRSHPERIDDTL